LRYGLPSRLKGLLELPGLYKIGLEEFAIPVEFGRLLPLVWRQIWKKNRDLL
jgi:hypothetical protein